MNTEPCKVLVVDQDRDNADTTVVLLQMCGHESEAAYSGEDAVAKAKNFDPDVILLDLGRVVVKGIDLAHELGRLCPEAKVVAITGFSPKDIVPRTRGAGIENVLFKPTPAKRLQEAVEAECAAPRSEP